MAFATLFVVVGLAPVFFLHGVAGALLAPLGTVIIVATLASRWLWA